MERGRISEDMTPGNMLPKAEKDLQGKNEQLEKAKVSNATLKQQNQTICHSIKRHSVFHGGNLYYFSCGSMSWNDAEKSCVSRGSHLTSVTSLDEQEFIYKKDANATFWIGLTNQKSSNWIWTDGSPFNETQSKMFWAPGQPNNWEHNEHCVVSWTVNHKSWMDKDCQKHFKFICKRKCQSPRLCSWPTGSSDHHTLNKVDRPANKSASSY
ncbi:C-type lectin domain family 4 member K-like isoform X2 [Petaurus breviceps papuanus]|uniref:C-type lectin domain family 4 member K-like isoform X2 n=1 Tax=Petaurus breviceps papuanus TaxID=3040969 RepID=UPI0036D81415